MKQVTIPVYEYNELSAIVQEKLRQSIIEQLVDLRFEVFPEVLSEQLLDKYGIVGEFGYSLSYCQGDGLHFNTEQFLTKQTAQIIREKLETDFQRKVLDKFISCELRISCRKSNNFYEYASGRDVSIVDETDAIDVIAEQYNLKYTEVEAALYTIREKAASVYLTICKEYETEGYAQYNISEEEVKEALESSYYYADGRYYDEIND